MRRGRDLALLSTALAGVAVLLGQHASQGPWGFTAGFAVAWLWRLLAGRDGRALLPRRVLGLGLALLLATALPFLLDLAGKAAREEFFEGLLGTLTCFLGLALLAPLEAFGAFWTVLLASTQAAIACSLADDLSSAALLVACVALLCWTLVALERATAELHSGGVRRLVDPGAHAGRALRAASLSLAGLGLAAGLSLWLLAPRPGPRTAEGERSRAQEGPAAEAGMESGVGARAGAVIGPEDTPGDDAVLGSVDRIQQDNRVHVEVRLVAGAEQPTLLLREAVRDLWQDAPGSVAARWRSSRSQERGTLPTEADGWTLVGAPVAGRPERTLEARMRLGSGLVFLEPEALAFRVERPVPGDPDAPRSPLDGLSRRLGSSRIERRLLPGDVIVMRGQPQPREGAELAGRESSARVSPLRSYAEIEPRLAARLRDLARGVPGLEGADAWRRAQALEAWLQGPDFAYELSSPVLTAGRRVEDFLGRVRRGNCEWYATALTLLLRAHGHAARYAQGYWGGSHTPGSDLWAFHGTSYHAWTELYLDGVGWVPLNPTPPERMAALAGGRTAEAGRHAARDDRGGAPALRERLHAWAAAAGRWLAEGARRSGPTALLLGLAAGGATLLLLARLLGRRRRGAHAGASRSRERSALAEALRLLARRGFARPSSWTAREYLARTGAALRPEAQAALARLTARHERRVYGGQPQPEEDDRHDLGSLASALRPGTPG